MYQAIYITVALQEKPEKFYMAFNMALASFLFILIVGRVLLTFFYHWSQRA